MLLPFAGMLMGQGLPLPRCDYGGAMAALTSAERLAATAVTGLDQGRALGEALAPGVVDARERFARCGCLAAADLLLEAAEVAGPAASEASAPRIQAVLAQTRFRLGLVRQRVEGAGCR